MTAKDKPQVPTDALSTGKLNVVLGKSERVKGLADEAADDLATVNQDLKKKHAGAPAQDVIEKTEAVEAKVQKVAEDLSVVNEALHHEVKDRELVDRRLAAVTEQEEAARHAAMHDPLTGLPNRALFDDRIGLAIAHAQRHHSTLAVMFLDLDGFKPINDTHGHAAGDELLRSVAARLEEHTRSGDTLSRHGGDEFLYLLVEFRDEADITRIVEKIVDAMKVPFDISSLGRALEVHASIGIAVFPRHGNSAGELVKSADRAMYVAKKNASGYAFAD